MNLVYLHTVTCHFLPTQILIKREDKLSQVSERASSSEALGKGLTVHDPLTLGHFNVYQLLGKTKQRVSFNSIF